MSGAQSDVVRGGPQYGRALRGAHLSDDEAAAKMGHPAEAHLVAGRNVLQTQG
jgi:hypothetical protein